jgi:hypothetical protein
MESVSDGELLQRVSVLEPTSFENLTLDLLRAAGFRNLVWRTPGADGGRDIEGEQTITDLSGTDFRQRWYIECKRYNSSIDWPTIWKKIAYADSQGADFLLLVTNSQPSPQCETEIRTWNEGRRRPGLRVWRGYDIPMYLRLNENVAVAHGIARDTLTTSSFAIEFASALSKLAQAAHGAWVFEANPEIPLVSAATLAELFHQRLQSLSHHGRFVTGAKLRDIRDWPWLAVTGEVHRQEEVGFRAVVSAIRHVLQADRMECVISEETSRILAVSSKSKFKGTTESFLAPILQWALCDAFRVTGEREVEFSLRV